MHFSHRTQRTQDGSEFVCGFLPEDYLSWYWKSTCTLSKEGVNRQSYPATILRNHNKDLHCTIASRMQEWYTYLGGKQQLTS